MVPTALLRASCPTPCGPHLVRSYLFQTNKSTTQPPLQIYMYLIYSLLLNSYLVSSGGSHRVTPGVLPSALRAFLISIRSVVPDKLVDHSATSADISGKFRVGSGKCIVFSRHSNLVPRPCISQGAIIRELPVVSIQIITMIEY